MFATKFRKCQFKSESQRDTDHSYWLCQDKSERTQIKGNRRNVVSKIEILKKFEKGLLGIDDYSHLMVLFWMHETPAEERKKMTVHPWNDTSLSPVGVFAIRRRARPNPIGLAVVELIREKVTCSK